MLKQQHHNLFSLLQYFRPTLLVPLEKLLWSFWSTCLCKPDFNIFHNGLYMTIWGCEHWENKIVESMIWINVRETLTLYWACRILSIILAMLLLIKIIYLSLAFSTRRAGTSVYCTPAVPITELAQNLILKKYLFNKWMTKTIETCIRPYWFDSVLAFFLS